MIYSCAKVQFLIRAMIHREVLRHCCKTLTKGVSALDFDTGLLLLHSILLVSPSSLAG